ncbi:MAG: response regulator [Azonexus sp.]|jgi:CheY-like chemotaxis protein|nr:response regulator [Azonexus sp.]
MEPIFRVAVVEDNPPQRMIMTRLLEKEYSIEGFDSGAAFLASDAMFDAVLLDIEMPDLNGYDTCRRFREQSRGGETPVIFVSAHDTTPERVAAYEAGGDDFVTKPIAAHELNHKLRSAIEHRERVRALTSESSTAQQVAFTAMISMGDLGVVIEFLRKSALATSYSVIAARLIAAMKAWGLQGAVQVRGRHEQVNLNAEGPMSAMQAAVLEKLRDIGRIFEMGSRAVINFEHVSLLVENLPVEDPDKVGRLRDHLAVLAESADMRTAALDATNERAQQKLAVEATLAELQNAMQHIAARTSGGLRKSQTNLLESIEQLARTLATLGLTETQTGYLDDLVRHAEEDAHGYFDAVAQSDSEFTEVLNRLQRLAVADYRL